MQREMQKAPYYELENIIINSKNDHTIQALDTIERFKSSGCDCPLARAASTCLSMCLELPGHMQHEDNALYND